MKVFATVFFIISIVSSTVIAGELGKYETGVRGSIQTVDGEPTNDMAAFGITGRYRLNNGWLIGAAFDRFSDFDIEGPAEMVGIQQDPSVKTIDAKASATMISTWVEKRYGEKPEGGLSWFWTAGLGVNFINADDAKGATADGGSFDIEIDDGTEFVLSASAGPRYTFHQNWSVELGAKADYHIADWEMKDRISGQSHSVDNYTALGVYLGVNYLF